MNEQLTFQFHKLQLEDMTDREFMDSVTGNDLITDKHRVRFQRLAEPDYRRLRAWRRGRRNQKQSGKP